MWNFIKAVTFGFVVMALLMYVAHQCVGFDIVIDDRMVEPVVGLGVVMLAFIIAMMVVGLVVAGILGSVVLVGTVIALAVGGVVFVSGVLFSWPVLLGLVVLYLICRDKRPRRSYGRY